MDEDYDKPDHDEPDDGIVGNSVDVRLVAGPIRNTALVDEGDEVRPLWAGVAFEPSGRVAALGLFARPPTVGDLAGLLGDSVVEGGLGPQWMCPAVVSVAVDDAVLWYAHDREPTLAARGIAVYALPKVGADRECLDSEFAAVARSVAAVLKQSAVARGKGGPVLVTRRSAVEAVREWRAAREAEAAGMPPAGIASEGVLPPNRR